MAVLGFGGGTASVVQVNCHYHWRPVDNYRADVTGRRGTGVPEPHTPSRGRWNAGTTVCRAGGTTPHHRTGRRIRVQCGGSVATPPPSTSAQRAAGLSALKPCRPCGRDDLPPGAQRAGRVGSGRRRHSRICRQVVLAGGRIITVLPLSDA